MKKLEKTQVMLNNRIKLSGLQLKLSLQISIPWRDSLFSGSAWQIAQIWCQDKQVLFTWWLYLQAQGIYRSQATDKNDAASYSWLFRHDCRLYNDCYYNSVDLTEAKLVEKPTFVNLEKGFGLIWRQFKGIFYWKTIIFLF